MREFRQRGFKVRINRNIVECKAALFPIASCSKFVLIEKLWNVKIYSHPQIGRGEYCINRNIVECKVITD